MALSANNLSATFDHFVVFEDLSFKVDFGECLIIQGANGSGKTTLLNLLSTLTEPDEGKIEFKNQAIQTSTAYQQNIISLSHKNYLIENLSVKDNLEFLQILNRTSDKKNQQSQQNSKTNAEAILEQAKLALSVDQKISELSQGQKKRLLLSQFFSSNQTIWLLDEPLSSLDHQGIDLFEQMVSSHINQGGMALISSHQALKLNCNSKILEL